MYKFLNWIASLLAPLLLLGCSDGSDNPVANVLDSLPMNQLQYLGTHNSYHIEPEEDLFGLLLAVIPETAPTLQYTHRPLTEQLQELGIRQFELDVFADPQGGLYAERKVRTLFDEPAASGLAELDEPGLKVLHVQEIDYQTTCLTLVRCLQEIRQWSDDNPQHLPVMVLIEAKDEAIVDPLELGFSVPVPFDAAALGRIDTEIRSVFADARIILPDDVRGDSVTLEQAVLTRGWPTLGEARGKVMFALDNGGARRDTYVQGHSSLAGRVMFTDSPPGTPEAAFMKRNDPLSNPGEIADLVSRGYLVRTRADADTQESRNGDTTRRDAALASGAQFVSTDYPQPDPRFTDYQVTLPGPGVARCNPVNGAACEAAGLPLF
ncbi:MAG: hypothetical protein CME59_13960 [Halioglobus sp.]|nr:hypothetical protein [Halioglobus sp.]